MTHAFATRLARHEEEAQGFGAGASAVCLGVPSRGRGRPRWLPGACLAMAKARASWQHEAARLHGSQRESGGVRAGNTSAQPDLQSYILHGTATCWGNSVRQSSSTHPRPQSCPRRPTHPARAHMPRHQAARHSHEAHNGVLVSYTVATVAQPAHCTSCQQCCSWQQASHVQRCTAEMRQACNAYGKQTRAHHHLRVHEGGARPRGHAAEHLPGAHQRRGAARVSRVPGTDVDSSRAQLQALPGRLADYSLHPGA